MRIKLGIVALAAMTLAACGAGGAARDQIKIVGSSTVYPFATAVAETFVIANPGFKAPVIEQNGTGAGIKQFCGGLGAAHPDIVNASRRMKRSEFEECQENGVRNIVEVQVGIDGITLVGASDGPRLELTPADIYEAIAASPYGRPNTAELWSDVKPALPAIPITVYGPPASSGTRDALAELILTPGCDTDPATKALKDSNPDRHKQICTGLRTDGRYIEQGENDNFIVQKLAANPNAIGVLGYSFLAENGGSLTGLPIDGVTPSYETISDFSYPGARPLFIYVKADHLNAIKGLREYVAQWPKSWSAGGPLARRGLIESPAPVRTASAEAALELAPMSGDGLS